MNFIKVKRVSVCVCVCVSWLWMCCKKSSINWTATIDGGNIPPVVTRGTAGRNPMAHMVLINVQSIKRKTFS